MGRQPVRRKIRFWLNDELVELEGFGPSMNVLDFLRLEKGLRGSKEGCGEGDCGACTVLVGRLVDGYLTYESVNSCIRFVASLDGCHLVTIEHLRGENGKLHPVQEQMVLHHGSQCGFCTPGIVMSLYGLWMSNPDALESDVKMALQGNLCRCTGYGPIIRAAGAVLQAGGQRFDPLLAERRKMQERLEKLADGRRVEICRGGEMEKGGDRGLAILPSDVDDLAEVLLQYPGATIVGGATDVGLWVNKQLRELEVLVFISHLGELQGFEKKGRELVLGAAASYSSVLPAIERHLPQLRELWERIGGQQVRNMGTIGGNIANGSPIGDTPPALIALGGSLVLRRGQERRSILLEDYFLAYGRQDIREGEFIESIRIPLPGGEEFFAVYKLSKRREEDISTLCGAFRVRLENNRVDEITIAFGGMAEIPKRARAAEKALKGAEWNNAGIGRGAQGLREDFVPLSDVRGSAQYRMLAAKNLLQRFYLESTGRYNGGKSRDHAEKTAAG